MSNGDTQDSQDPKKKTDAQKAIDAAKAVGTDMTSLSKLVETLFGGASAAPTTAPRINTGPPQVTAPPQGGGSRFDPRGAAGGMLPQSPTGVGVPQGRADYPLGVEASTPRGAAAQTAGNAMSSIFGAIGDIAGKKKEEKIQHAQFLYNLVKTSYENGDEKTANIILQDDKNRQTIEKYLTGALPRVPGGPTRSETQYKPRTPGSSAMIPGASMDVRQAPGKLGDINKPGGPALPRGGAGSEVAAAIANMIKEGMQKNDPRIMDKVLGEGTASLSKEEYTHAMRAKYGIELSPAQEQALDKKSQLALSEAKVDVMKYVAGQTAAYDRAITVAKIHSGATVEAARVHENSRLTIAKLHRDLLVKLKGTAPDKMEGIMYKSLADLYTKMATDKKTPAAEAKDYVTKAENMKSQYEAGKFLDDIMQNNTDLTDEDESPKTPPKDDEEE